MKKPAPSQLPTQAGSNADTKQNKPVKTPTLSPQWFVYFLRCSDNSLYCGVTIDPIRRAQEHNLCNKKGAKYTRARRPVTLVYQRACSTKVAAYQQEYRLKRLSKAQKERLIQQHGSSR